MKAEMHTHAVPAFDVVITGPKAEVDRYRAHVACLEETMHEIANTSYGDLCFQLPYWAQWALEGKDTNGDPRFPVSTSAKTDE